MHGVAPSDRSAVEAGDLGAGGFDYDVAEAPNGVVVALRGELDLAAAPGLQRRARWPSWPGRSRASRSIWPSSTFLDSSGLGSLYRTRRAAEEGGVPLRLHAVPDHVMRVLDVTAMTPLFDLGAPGS